MTRFFVNRGGGRVPEGPFEEEQVVQFILAGKLSSGFICPVGYQRFTPLASHPSFADALIKAGRDPKATEALPRLTFDTKKTNRGLLLGAVLSIFGLALAAVAIGTYVMFSNGGMPARGAMPSDSEVFLEITNLPRFLAELRTVRALDSDQIASKQLLSDVANDLSKSFGISPARGDALLLAATSLGVAARKLSATPEGGVVLTFSSATPVNTLLSSKRFSYDGLVARNGRKYKLAAAPSEISASGPGLRRTLSGWSLDSPTNVLVWFETSKVLFLGSRPFAESMARVVSLDVPSLEQTPGFRAVLRDFSDKPNAIGYLDVTRLAARSPRVATLINGYLTNGGPVSASVRLTSAGLLARFVGHRSGPGFLGRAPSAPGQTLTVVDRLPSETFAYVASVTKSQWSGPELQKQLLDQIAATDPAAGVRINTGIQELEKRLNVPLDRVLGSIGEQGAIALVATPNVNLTLGPPQQMFANFGLVYLQALSDEGPARAVLNQVKTNLSPLAAQFKIEEDGDGYSLTPNDRELSLSGQIRFANGYLFVALGGHALVERAWRAFSVGEDTVATNSAQRTARAALPSKSQAVAWVDVGRVADTIQKNPLFAASGYGFDFSGVRWTGPDRVTAALTIDGDLRDGVYTYRVDTLNIPIFLGLPGLFPHQSSVP